jgi:hypothetical protein
MTCPEPVEGRERRGNLGYTSSHKSRLLLTGMKGMKGMNQASTEVNGSQHTRQE